MDDKQCKKHKRALLTLSVFDRQTKRDRQQQKEERSREEDSQARCNQTGSKDQTGLNFIPLIPSCYLVLLQRQLCDS